MVEKERNIQVMKFSEKWKDLGTWNTLSEVMGQPIFRNATIGGGSNNVHVGNGVERYCSMCFSRRNIGRG